MYPALGVTDGLITIEDLPDTVIYRGLIGGDKTFTKLDPPEVYGNYTAYYLTGSFPVGPDGDFIAIDSGGSLDQWTNYVGGGINGIGFCLIESFDNITGVNDTFADTYTVELDYENIGNAEAFVQENVVVTRVSLCQWEGLDSCGNLVELWYNSIDFAAEGQPVRLAEWNIEFYTNTQNSEEGPIPCSADDSWAYKKEEPANVPTGTYHSSELGTVIVS